MNPSDPKPFTQIEDARLFLEQRVYDHFHQTGDWPRARDFDLDYHELLDPLGGLEVVCRTIGFDRISCGSPTSESDRVTLRLPALAACRGADVDVENFLKGVRLAAKRYHAARGKDVQLKVADLVEDLKIDPAAAQRALTLILSDGRITGGGSTAAVSLSLLASRMRGVVSLDDYLARVADDDQRRLALARAAAGGPARRSPGPARRIFLSHAAADAALAHHLADIIRQGSHAAKVFVASKAGDIPTGSDWLDIIEAELKEADTYLLLLTPFSVKRFWLWYESGAAWMSGRHLVPVTAAGLAKAGVPYPLGARQALSLEDPADVAQLGRDLGAPIVDVDGVCDTIRRLSEALPWRAATTAAPFPIRASLERYPDRIVLTNIAQEPISAVNLTLDEPKNPIPDNERTEKLPIPLLEAGQSWPIVVGLAMGRYPPFHGVVEWMDAAGQRHSREVHIGG